MISSDTVLVFLFFMFPSFLCESPPLRMGGLSYCPKKLSLYPVEEDGFARLRAGRSAALACHRHAIHYRSPSNPS